MDQTQDRLLNGRVTLRQPGHGYRAGLDAALLAAACDVAPGQRVFEAGCGAGAALICAAWRRPGAFFTGLERDESAFALARQNLVDNDLADRANIIQGEVETGFKALGLAPFDAALCNPPFFDDPGALRAPAPGKAGAWMADAGLGAWTGFLLKSVREGGTLTLIHRADRLADLLSLLAPKAGSFRIRPVQPFIDAPAKRVILRAIKTGRAPLVLLPALVLHPRSGAKHTQDVEAILRGDQALAWDT